MANAQQQNGQNGQNGQHGKQNQGSGPRPRILRIGVLLGDTFIEERLIRERKTVSVGQSHKNTFSIPVDGLPKAFNLFELRDGNYYLNFTKRMKGRLAVGGKPRTLESLRDREAKRHGDHYVLPMENNARGKIEIGEMRLLFQFVAAPPLQPRPRLPASVRGTLADRIDPRLAIILAVSILVHFGIGIMAFNHDKTVDRRAERLQREFRADVYTPPEEIEVIQDTTATADTTDTGSASEKPTKVATNTGNDKPAKDNTDTGDSGTPDDAAINEAIANSALMAVLGGGEGADGRYAKGEDIDEGAGLGAGIDNIKKTGKEVSGRGGSGGGRTRGPNSGKIGSDVGGGKIGGAKGGGGSGPAKEEKIKSRASLSPIADLSDGELDPSAVFRKIKSSYLRGIRACHERALKTNPKIGGRVNLRFTVGPTGRLTRKSAKGFDSTVDACIKGLMGRWRFGAPKDEDGKPASASFSIPVVLKAGG